MPDNKKKKDTNNKQHDKKQSGLYEFANDQLGENKESTYEKLNLKKGNNNKK